MIKQVECPGFQQILIYPSATPIFRESACSNTFSSAVCEVRNSMEVFGLSYRPVFRAFSLTYFTGVTANRSANFLLNYSISGGSNS